MLIRHTSKCAAISTQIGPSSYSGLWLNSHNYAEDVRLTHNLKLLQNAPASEKHASYGPLENARQNALAAVHGCTHSLLLDHHKTGFRHITIDPGKA